MDKINNFVIFIVSQPIFHIIYVSICLLIILCFFFFRHRIFFSADSDPPLINFNPFKRASLRSTVVIKTGLMIKNFSQFNVMKNNFVMDGVIWFEFNPHLVSIEKIENFSFENMSVKSKAFK